MGYAGSGGDLLDGGGVVALLAEQAERGGTEAVVGGRPLSLTPVRLRQGHIVIVAYR